MNRLLLALLGLVLLTAGAGTLAVNMGKIPGVDRDAALVPGTAMPPTWVLVAVAVASILIALLCVRWLFAQVPRTPVSAWRWTGEEGTTRVSTATIVAPFIDELTLYPGVRKAEASLTGSTTTPELAIVVRAHSDADLREIRRRIDDEGVPRLGQAVGATEIRSTVEFRILSSTGDVRVS